MDTEYWYRRPEIFPSENLRQRKTKDYIAKDEIESMNSKDMTEHKNAEDDPESGNNERRSYNQSDGNPAGK